MNDPGKIDTIGRVAAIVLIAGFAALVSHQTIRPYLAARKDLVAFEEAVQILSEAEGSVDRLNAEIQVVTSEIAKSEALLPKDLNLDGFLEQLGGLASKTGTRIESLKPREVGDLRLCRELPLEVSISGSFLAIYDFLNLLENGDRLARVENLKITRNESSDVCEAEIRLALYFGRAEAI